MRQRLLFEFATGAEAVVDTGGPVFGEIHQVRWHRASGDTGGEVELTLLLDGGDTGPGIVVMTAGLTPAGWLKFPRMPSHDPLGDVDGDTGAPAAPQPVIACFERLRVKLTPGNTGVTGRLWCWVK